MIGHLTARKLREKCRRRAILYINERIAWRIKTHFCFFMSLYIKIDAETHLLPLPL
jgi:hypothetical protein